MNEKYYAVRCGRTPGIYLSWNDCKKQVDGYPGARYKSFTNASDASDFINQIPIKRAKLDDNGRPLTDKENAVAYVDGSYNIATKVYAYGVVMFYDGGEVHLSGNSSDEELAQMRNVAGEIEGSMAAMRYGVEHNIKSLIIYHDYEGIAKWCLEEWKTNKEGTKAYKNYYDSVKKKIDISFVKVKGHSNDVYNDLADRLAKAAAGID